MSERSIVKQRLDEIIRRLSEPLSDVERRHGWAEASRKAMQRFFEGMRDDAEQGKKLAAVIEYVTIVRGLDSWGISSGPLFDAAMEIQELAARA